MCKFMAILTFPLLLFALAAVHAQSMFIIGGDSFAHECFTASNLAVQLNSASEADINKCNRAIKHSALKKRDLIATYVNRGILFAAMEEYQLAGKDYQSAINLEPGTGEVFLNLGNLYFIDQKFISAINQYDKAISLELGKVHIAYYNRGMAWENLGDKDKAESDYRQAIDLLPEWTTPQKRLKRMHERTKKHVNNS